MIHIIIIVYGDSDITYGCELGNWENWPQEVLQRNAAGPTIWAVLSAIIFNILHERGFKSNIISSISKQLFCIVGYAYVDDCDFIQVGDDPVEVLSSMQKKHQRKGGNLNFYPFTVPTDEKYRLVMKCL